MPSTRKKPKITKLPKATKYNSRPKKGGVVKEHTRMIAGRRIAVREHVRVMSRGQLKKFKVTTQEEASNTELFSWNGLSKIEHLNPIVVEMSPEDFLFLTAEWKIQDYSPDFEMAHAEKFDEMTERFDKQTEKRIKLVEEHAAEIKLADEHAMSTKEKKAPLVLVIGPDGQIRRHSQDSRERAQALAEMGCSEIPVIILEEVK